MQHTGVVSLHIINFQLRYLVWVELITGLEAPRLFANHQIIFIFKVAGRVGARRSGMSKDPTFLLDTTGLLNLKPNIWEYLCVQF